MTTPQVHCMSNLPTAHEPTAADGAEGDDEPRCVNGPTDRPATQTAGDEWGDGRVPARVAPMSLRPLG
jgi:hypothetical protein